jgi:DNA-binding NarL/FixJ family response regulator
VLTVPEWEVMERLSEGQTTDEVARRLFAALATVRVHISSVLRKLGVKDRRAPSTWFAGIERDAVGPRRPRVRQA